MDDDLDFMTDEEIQEILEVEKELGIDISLEEILDELEGEDDDLEDWSDF